MFPCTPPLKPASCSGVCCRCCSLTPRVARLCPVFLSQDQIRRSSAAASSRKDSTSTPRENLSVNLLPATLCAACNVLHILADTCGAARGFALLADHCTACSPKQNAVATPGSSSSSASKCKVIDGDRHVEALCGSCGRKRYWCQESSRGGTLQQPIITESLQQGRPQHEKCTENSRRAVVFAYGARLQLIKQNTNVVASPWDCVTSKEADMRSGQRRCTSGEGSARRRGMSANKEKPRAFVAQSVIAVPRS